MYNALGRSKNDYANLPCKLARHCALKLDDFVYCIGGFVEGSIISIPTSNVYRLNAKTANSQWEEIASMNERRCEFGAATWNSNLVVAGGYNASSQTSSTELYQPHLSRIWRTIASMNEGRIDHQLVVANNKLLAIGGSDDQFQTLSSVEQLDNVDGRWTFIKPMNVERRGFAAVTCNNFIYVMGGTSRRKIHKTVEKYDFNKNEWSFVKNMKLERKRHAACVLSGRIFVIGGVSKNDEAVKQIKCYEPISDEWSIVDEIEQEFVGHAVVAV